MILSTTAVSECENKLAWQKINNFSISISLLPGMLVSFSWTTYTSLIYDEDRSRRGGSHSSANGILQIVPAVDRPLKTFYKYR